MTILSARNFSQTATGLTWAPMAETAEANKSYFGQSPCQTIIAGDINGDCKVDWDNLPGR